jgi:molybdopterin/thiamine biosynthesis adenylyltransferase
MNQAAQALLTLVIIGLGNIGSALMPLIAFLPGLRRVLLVDLDTYEARNLAGQQITRRDVGRAKALVQARRLRALNPALEVHAMVSNVSDVPLNQLRGALMIGCVDSLETRIQLNQIALRLGMTWLDGGVEPGQHLVRVQGHLPGPENPCFACGLSDEDYRSLGSRQPCQAATTQPSATAGPASLGALCASLLAEEAAKLLMKRHEAALLGRQLILETEQHSRLLNVLRRNPQCRADHTALQLTPVPGLAAGLTLGRALDVLAAGAGGPVAMTVVDKTFTRQLRCPGCGRVRPGLHVMGRLPAGESACPDCRREMLASGLDLLAALDSSLAPELRSLRLRQLGIQPGDILEVSGPRNHIFHCEIARRDVSACEIRRSFGETESSGQGLAPGGRCEDRAARRRAQEIV